MKTPFCFVRIIPTLTAWGRVSPIYPAGQGGTVSRSPSPGWAAVFHSGVSPICIKSLKTLISLLAISRYGLYNAAVLFMVSLASATKMRQL